MGRPKEFDRETVVRKAMLVFWDHGYKAVSTEDLARAMNIGRQSMYDTFGDKHTIFIEALQCYQHEQGGQLREALADSSPLRAIEAVLFSVSAERAADRMRGCMMVNATTECAGVDADVRHLVASNSKTCEAAFEQAVRAAQLSGELPSHVDARAAGRFLFAVLQGLRVTAKGGASPEVLRDVAQTALVGIGARSSERDAG